MRAFQGRGKAGGQTNEWEGDWDWLGQLRLDPNFQPGITPGCLDLYQ